MNLGSKLQATINEIQRKKEEAVLAEAARLVAERNKERKERAELIEHIKYDVIFQIEGGQVPEVRLPKKSDSDWIRTVKEDWADIDIWDGLESWADDEGLVLEVGTQIVDQFNLDGDAVTIFAKPKKVVDLPAESDISRCRMVLPKPFIKW